MTTPSPSPSNQPSTPGAKTSGQAPIVLAAALGLSVLGLTLFAAFALDGGTRGFDEWLLRGLRDPVDLAVAIGPMWFQELVRDVSALGSTGILTGVVLVVAGYLVVIHARREALFLVVAVSLGTLLNRILKLAIARPRPDIVPHGTYVSNESFPSGHAANSAIVYLVLAMMIATLVTSRAGKIYVYAASIFVVAIVGLSRIYLGVHYPSDVIAGWMVGAIWALLCWYALTRLEAEPR